MRSAGRLAGVAMVLTVALGAGGCAAHAGLSAPRPPPGDEGDDVRALQARLGALRYWNGEPDGRYGGLTEQAVMA